MNLVVKVRICRDGNQYVAHAHPLDVLSSGPTPQTEREAVDESVLALPRARVNGTIITQPKLGSVWVTAKRIAGSRRGLCPVVGGALR